MSNIEIVVEYDTRNKKHDSKESKSNSSKRQTPPKI